MLERKEKATLSQKRSFLVRMVSDPKCYNPKIVRHLTMGGFRKMNEDVVRDLSLREAIGRTKIKVTNTNNMKYFKHDNVNTASSSSGPSVDEEEVIASSNTIRNY
ncbi:hypothetical protein WUBG_03498 [Wuchereria bancrofti]|uniref:Uncharacterized protein n=1 Tax=Wuchereria bancrofti TaxID=6293 RepID=J9F7W1_WUCBA|nr:hypothetical protein WUBG_03498 [Wuchereria bancrofti]